MIIKLNSQDQALLTFFIKDTRTFKLAKEHNRNLKAFEYDVAAGQVNSDRLKKALPILQASHSQFLGRLNAVTKYSLIAKWKRILVIPAVFQFVFKLLPFKRRTLKHLNNIASAMNRLKEGIK